MRFRAVDLFCGAGGVTIGLKRAGVKVVAAVDNDEDCLSTMRANHSDINLLRLDLQTISPARLRQKLNLSVGELDILTACSPCQTFSSLGGGKSGNRDARTALVSKIAEIALELRPKALIMENVVPLQKHKRFRGLIRALRRSGYSVVHTTICASEVGVPQRRLRLVFVAIRSSQPLPTLDLKRAATRLKGTATVREAFEALRADGLVGDPLQQSPHLSDIVKKRIKMIPKDGGSRSSLRGGLKLACHRRLESRGVSGSVNVYGRMSWDKPAPTLTTRCTTPSCGRFIHPSNNRPVTLREAAVLQAFPPRYKFAGTNRSVERQIGNAVPPTLAASTAIYVVEILRKYFKFTSSDSV